MIIRNHPFVDVNKRTAFATAKELFKEYHMDLKGYKLFAKAKGFLKKFIFP